MADVEEGKKDLIRTIEILMRKPAFDAVGQIKGFPWYEDEGSFALWQKILMADLNAKTGVDGKIEGRSFAQKDFAEAGHLRDHFGLPEYDPINVRGLRVDKYELRDGIDPDLKQLKAAQDKMLETLLIPDNVRVIAGAMKAMEEKGIDVNSSDDAYLRTLAKAVGIDEDKYSTWESIRSEFREKVPTPSYKDFKANTGTWAGDNPDRKAIDAYIKILSPDAFTGTNKIAADEYESYLEKLRVSAFDDIDLLQTPKEIHEDIFEAIKDANHPLRQYIAAGSEKLNSADAETIEGVIEKADVVAKLLRETGDQELDFIKSFEASLGVAKTRLQEQKLKVQQEAEAAAAQVSAAEARKKQELEPAAVDAAVPVLPKPDVLVVPPADAARIEAEARANEQAEAAEAERVKALDAALEQEMKEQSRQRAEQLKGEAKRRYEGERQRLTDATPDPRLRPKQLFEAAVSRVTSPELQSAAQGIMAKYQEAPQGLSGYALSALKRHFAKNQSEAVIWQSEKDFALHGLITPGLKTILKETRNGRSDSEAAENAREQVMEALTLYADAAKRGSSQALIDLVAMVKEGGIHGHSWKKLGFGAAESPNPQEIYDMITDTRDALRARQAFADSNLKDRFVFAANDQASLRTVRAMEQEMLSTFKNITPKAEGDVRAENVLSRQGMDFGAPRA